MDDNAAPAVRDNHVALDGWTLYREGMGNERARVHLRQVSVAIHCTVGWNKMRGDGAVRFCGSCRQNVYNLSEMSEDAAEALLARDEDACIRYYYRPDGTIVTSACPTTTASSRVPAIAVAGALAYTTAFVGISTAVEPAEVASHDQSLQVAMGIKLTIKKPLTPEEREHARKLREERRRQRALEDSTRDFETSLAPSRPELPAQSVALTVDARPVPAPRWPTIVVLFALLGAAAVISIFVGRAMVL